MKLSVPIVAILAAITLCAQGTTIVTGRITDSVTGLPIEEASITLEQESYHASLQFTDQSGGFTFDDVPSGTVNVRIRKENYLPFETTNPGDTAIEATAANPRHDFILTPSASLTGRVTGVDPGFDVRVTLFEEDYTHGFPRYLPVALPVGTGADKSFSFVGLTPGRYIVRADSIHLSGNLFCRIGVANACPAQSESENSRGDEGYVDTWFPGAAEFGGAVPLTLSAGEKQNAEFPILKRPLFSVTGRIVLPAAGLPSPNVSFFMADTPAESWSARTSDGSFTIHDMPSGQYVARATIPNPALEASLSFAITDHDAEGLKLSFRPQLQINGIFRMENGDAPPSGLSLYFLREVPRPLALAIPAVRQDQEAPAPVPADARGAFTFYGFPDEYSVQPIVPAGYAVTEIRYAGANSLNRLIPISGDTSDSSLTIVLTNQPSAVAGLLTDSAGKPLAAKIVLAPWTLPENFDPRSLRVAITDKQGAFAVQGLPPGKYRATVLTGDDRKRDHDLAILNDKFATADTFELTAGQNLAITPKP